MVKVSDIVRRMKAGHIRFLPRASEKDIREAEATLGVVLPDMLHQLCRHGNGQVTLYEVIDDDPKVAEHFETQDSDGEFWRLMSLDEVVEIHPDLVRIGWNDADHICLWTDDESNYLCLVTGGLLKGRVCRLSHDGGDSSYLYRSLDTLLPALAEAGIYGFEHEEAPGRDYPPTAPWDAARTAEERAVTAALWEKRNARPYKTRAEITDTDEWHRYSGPRWTNAVILCSLTPWEDSETLYTLLDDPDFYSQQWAAESLGRRGYAPAIPHLVRVAQRTVPNSPAAAVDALARIGTPDAIAALRSLAETVTDDHVRMVVRHALADLEPDGQTDD